MRGLLHKKYATSVIEEVSNQVNEIEQFRFRVSIDGGQIEDLMRRLRQTRWPIEPNGAPWEFGTSQAYLRSVVDYWVSEFDWQEIERQLNGFAHYRIPVDGRFCHAIIEPGSGENPLPLVLFHGWPGCFTEYLPLARRLAHPEAFGGDANDGATVIIASLPGTGFSDPPASPTGPREVGQIWHQLLTEILGLSHYALHGGDWGAAISSWMAIDQPASVLGIHLTSAILQQDPASLTDHLREDEQAYLATRVGRGPWESGYQVIQGTKPLTLAYGLTDSPAGLAAWILEKYHGWSSAKSKNQPPSFSLDDLLTIVTLYWLAGPGPSTWIYRSLIDGTGLRLHGGVRVEVPTWLCQFADDVSPPSPASWQERTYNVTHRSEVGYGSHFPGLDAPDPLAADIIAFLSWLGSAGSAQS
jgi:pimeloyl-ACP methyl ester carboxylesterase